MKKRILSVLLVCIMLLSILPVDSLAAGTRPGGNTGTGRYGSNLGWEYSLVTENGRGYTLKDPYGTSKHLGSHVHVTLDGEAISEGYSNRKLSVLSSSSTSVVNVSADYGYYIKWIVLACGDTSDKNPFNCQTVQGDNAFSYALPSSTPTSVNINIADLYAHANHASSASNYFLMIELAPMPTDIYVGYDSGSINGTNLSSRPVSETGALSDGAVEVASFPTWCYDTTGLTAAPSHAALSISPEAEAEANALGYSFAGWSLSYYTGYTESTNTFTGTMTLGGSNLPTGTQVTLSLNAKLTAIWQPLTTISVSKVWDDADNRDGIRPDSVTILLYANGVPTGKSLTLNAENNWYGLFEDLCVNESGSKIFYTIVEEQVSGYISEISGNDSNGFEVTNTHDIETTDLTVTKVWNDNDNQDGMRPGSITVSLFADGVDTGKTLTLSAENLWSDDFNGLPVYKEGEHGTRIQYTVREIEDVDGYTSEVNGTTITNTHITEKISYTVRKVWDDANNQDGIRPESITVVLFANGKATGIVQTLDGSEATPWTAVFEDLPVYENGMKINYTVVEDGYVLDGASHTGIPEGYTSESVLSGNVFTVTNHYTPEQTSLDVFKVWNDDFNRDGIRPDSVTVTLLKQDKSGEFVSTGKTITLSSANNWSGSFSGLAKYENGVQIHYSVSEADVPGYTAEYDVSEASGIVTISNTHTSSVISIDVAKRWNDSNDQDGMRPTSVSVQLYANGTPCGESVVLSDANNWQYTWNDCYENDNGTPITYTVREVDVPDGYTAAVTGNVESGFVITNSHSIITTSVPVQKIWDDNDNQDGIRPDSVTVTLYADGVAIKTLTLNAENHWKGSFDELAMYAADSHGRAVVYTVGEANADIPEGYTPSVNGNVITNTHLPSLTSVKVEKVWNDDNNRDDVRPDSVSVQLLINNAPYGSAITLSDDNNWIYIWSDLPEFSGGLKNVYTVREVNVPDGYTAAVTGNAETGFVITNSHNIATTFFTFHKIWDDASNRDGIRPAGVAIQIYADEVACCDVIILNDANNWSATSETLPVYAESKVGQKIEYTYEEVYYVDEDGNPIDLNDLPYTSGDATVETDGTLTFTNTHTPETTSVTVTKIWNDEDNRDGARPDSITITLLRDNAPTTLTAALSEDNNWCYTFENLDVYHDGGIRYVYSVKESTVNGYASELTGAADEGFIVTNSRSIELINVPVKKIWDDNGNQDGIRPDSITVILLADGKEVDRMTLTSTENWEGIFKDVPKYREGKVGEEIVYTINESAVNGYTASFNGTTVTNTHIPETTSVNVEKIWNDANNNDHKRPYAVLLTLYANGIETDQTLLLSSENKWRGSFTDLAMFSSGLPINYTVVESGYYATAEDLADANFTGGIAEGYTASYQVQSAGRSVPGITVTNSYTPETTSLSVRKSWNDSDNQDGIRPDSVTVTLFSRTSESEQWMPVQGENNSAKTVTLTNENHWSADFTDLPKYDDGKQILYTVIEQTLEGYTATYTVDEASGVLTVTNTHSVEKTNISVRKQWDDADNQDGIRPDSIMVTLFANGVATEKTLTLSEQNAWSGTFKDLDVNHLGTSIVYSVVETVPEGYESNVTGSIAEGFVITNTHTPEITEVHVSKLWVDADNQDGIRSDHVTVSLLANGEAIDTAQLSEQNGWHATFDSLPVCENGTAIRYTIEEAQIDGYTAAFSYNTENDGIIEVTLTNTHTPETTTLRVEKVWNDASDQDGIRPGVVTVELLADGVPTGKTEKLTAAANWSFTWQDLDKYHAGEEIVYSVRELAVEGYEASYEAKDGVITVTNTHEVEIVHVDVAKIWNDDANRDGLRSEQIRVILLVDGEESETTLTLNAENNWVGAFDQLPKFRDHGIEIVYTVREADLPNGYTSEVTQVEDLSFNITNTHTPASTGVSVKKVWDDEQDNDGKRPDGIIVQLSANGSPIEDAQVVLSAENDWQYTWRELTELPLYVFANGKQIDYTVDEIGYVLDGKRYDGLPEGYTNQTSGESYEICITNTRQTEKTSVTISKLWEDDNNRDGIRPESIEVTLYRNGEALKTATLSEQTQWSYTFSELYRYVGGSVAVYTVKETPVEGYTASYDRSFSDNVTLLSITNTHTPETVDYTLKKLWSDDNNSFGYRPKEVTVRLYKNGIAYGDPIVLSQKDDWKVNVTLVKFEDGKMIDWTIKEIDVPDHYRASYDQKTLTITNILTVTRDENDIPKTGDQSMIWLWGCLMALSGSGLVTLLLYYRRKGRKYTA